MQLPQSLQKFSHPTLIVIANNIHATFWLAQGEELKELGTIEHSRELKSDNEASFVNPNHGGSTSGPEPKIEQERMKKFCKELASRITQHLAEPDPASPGAIKHIYLAMKKELMHPVEEHLAKPTQTLINRRLDADLMKDDILEVVDRLLKAWK